MKTLNTITATLEQPDIREGFLREIKLLLILLFSVFALSSCSGDDDNNCIDETDTANVTSVDAPETVMVNEPVNVEVQFLVSNACGEFNRFIEAETGMSREIIVEAVYEGCACAEVIESRTANYPFEANEPGEYELNFRSGETEFITATITVTEME